MPRTYASESRLIHRRLASGKKPTTRVVTGKDEFNRPIVQQRTDVARNAQNVERAKTLSAKSDVVESYIDPKTGADSRERDNEGNFIEGTGTLFKNRVSGPLAPTLARRDSTEGPSTIVTNDALTRLRNQANGDSTNPNDELQLGSGQSPRAQGTGVIEQRRNARLDANNATQQQRQRNQLALRGIADPVGEKLASVRARIAQEEASGTHSYTVEEKAMMEQQAIAEGQAELQVQQQASDQATQQAQATGVAGDKTTQSKGQQQTQFTPEQSQQQAALQAAISGLPPEMQPFGQAIMQSLQSSQQGQSDLNRGLQAQGQSFQDQRDDLESTIRGIADRADQTFQAIDKNAQSIRDRNEQNLNEQEAAAKARLDWQEQEQTRKLNDQKKKAIDSKIAQLAMTGRANSSGGLKELEEVGREYEKAISDLQIEMGVQRTELAARFTALHTEVWNDYELGYENNRKDLTATLERISLQGLSSRQAIAKAEDNALQAFIQNTIGLRKEAAKTLQDGISQVYGLIADDRNFKRQSQETAWNRLEWAKSTFGTNPPPGLADQLAKDLPGVDVAGLLATPTAAEMKRARSGSGIGAMNYITFASSELDSTGRPPTLVEYIDMKQREFNKGQSGPVLVDEKLKKQWRIEYDAKIVGMKKLDPAQIGREFKDKLTKSGFGSVYAMKKAEETLNGYLASGDYAEARRYVDGMGKMLAGGQVDSYTQAITVRNNLSQMQQILERLRNRVGPVIGQFVSRNPYDSDVAQLNNLIAQTTSPLGRGIFKETGAFTDQDAARFAKALASPTMTYENAVASLRLTQGTVESVLANSINFQRAAGYNVRDIQQQIENAPNLAPDDPEPIPGTEDYIREYLRSQGY